MKPRNLLLICATALLPFAMQAHAVEDAPGASAEFVDNDGDAVGYARIEQGPVGVIINLELSDLPEGWKAIHIHGKGECHDHEDGFQASGGHLNPDDAEHGFMNPEGPDAGDLPNFYVHDDGTAMVEMFNERVSLDGSFGGNMMHEDGTALVIHEAPDDHMTQPIGGAGARIACGVVEGN